VLTMPMYVAAGLQQRWQAVLLPATPTWQLAAAAAAVLHVLSVGLACWAMCTNKFFSSVVSGSCDSRLSTCGGASHPSEQQKQHIVATCETDNKQLHS
jgi:hypothetical protein